jgi:hypothetical protein
MLRNRQQPEAKDMTGSNMARMLAEMEQIKQMKSPYTTAAKDIEREALQLRSKLETVISAIEQMWNFGIAVDVKLNRISEQMERPSATKIIKESVETQSNQLPQTSKPNQQS